MVGAWIAALAVAAPCDDAEAVMTAEALPTAAEELRDELAAMGIAAACPGAPALAEAAGQVAQVEGELREVADAQLAVTDPQGWAEACTGGKDALEEALKLPDGRRRALLWDACGLAATGWFSQEEWSDSRGLVVVALVAGTHLAASGVAPETTRAMVRAVAGVGVGGGATPPDFAEGGRVEPTWSRKAKKVGGVCVVRIGVTPSGSLRKVVFLDCPDALRGDVTAAVDASTLVPATDAGSPAPGRFEVTYTVTR